MVLACHQEGFNGHHHIQSMSGQNLALVRRNIIIIIIILRFKHEMLNISPEVIKLLQGCGWHHHDCFRIHFVFEITQSTRCVKSSTLKINSQLKSSNLLCFTHALIMIPTSVLGSLLRIAVRVCSHISLKCIIAGISF